MPELPEVETTRRGIAPHLRGQHIAAVVVREPRLRWPVPPDLGRRLSGQTVEAVERRAKYLLLRTARGCLIVHLGMSGSLRVVAADTPAQKHDHLDLVLSDGRCLRLRDPRRFGAVLWTEDDPLRHPLLAELGPEPWDPRFDGEYLYRRARGRQTSVKPFIMDSHVVVGVGNIYASEALFRAGVHPARPAGRIGRQRYVLLAGAIREVLERAIRFGGTTLRDFVDSEGRPGYFRHELQVYARAGEACPGCAGTLRQRVIAQRASYFCVRCQR